MSDKKPILTFKTGPFKDVNIYGHRTVEERDAEAGRPGLTLEDADYSDLYRGGIDEVYDKWIPWAEKGSGYKREVNAELTAKSQARAKEGKTVKDVLDTQVTFATKLQAKIEPELWKNYDAQFRAFALETPIDASPSKRTGAASKANLEKADDILNRTPDRIESAVTTMLGSVPEFDLIRDEEGKPERTSLARLVGAHIAVQLAGV